MAAGSTRVDGASPCRADLVAPLQPALTVSFLVAPSGAYGSGLDARGRREPSFSQSFVSALQTAWRSMRVVAASCSLNQRICDKVMLTL